METDSLEKQAKDGDHEACYKLGYRYLWGVKVKRSRATALKWFQKGASLGSAKCMRGEGNYWYSKDPEKAGRCFMRALEAGDVEAGEELLSAVEDPDGFSPVARIYQSLGVDAAYLTKHGVEIPEPEPDEEIDWESPEAQFIAAVAQSDLPAMRRLLKSGVDIDQPANGSLTEGTALHCAASLGLVRATRLLIKQGAAVNPLDNLGLTPLMGACSLGRKKGSQVALLLIEAGADVAFVREADSMTALKFAVESCTAEAVRALLAKGALIEGPPGCQTPLMHAARANNVTTARVLVESGANIETTSKLPWATGWTAERFAREEGCRAVADYLAGVVRLERKNMS